MVPCDPKPQTLNPKILWVTLNPKARKLNQVSGSPFQTTVSLGPTDESRVQGLGFQGLGWSSVGVDFRSCPIMGLKHCEASIYK